jgi:Fur family transcriptional regulator, ferric uptake regulator
MRCSAPERHFCAYNCGVVNPVEERLRERALRVLADRRLKLTRPRRAIVDWLLSLRGKHFLAENMRAEINKDLPGSVSRATVYRTLDILTEAGVLIKTRVNESSFHYEMADLEGHHHHLIDTTSGRVVGFKGDDELHKMLERICRKHGFNEQYHVLEVFGRFSEPSQDEAPRGSRRSAARPESTGGRRG